MQHFLKGALAAGVFALSMGVAHADLAPLNSDAEADRMDWSELDAKFGPLAAPPAGTKIGGVSKTLTNEYWRSLGQGYQNVADKLGIDLIWFGVLLGVNMQTSFMHPPFGFALFYLRGIADTLFKEGRIEKPVKSNDIYMGAIPWVLMQIVLVVIVIFVPETVTMFLDKEEKVDLDKVVIEMPSEQEVPDAELKLDGPAPTAAQSAADEQKKMDDLFKK